MKIKVGDKVKVITGANKGKDGKVIEVDRKNNRVIIEKVNIVKKHVKPNGQNDKGGILEIEAPIHVSNVKKLEEDKKAKKEAKVAKKETKTKEPKKATKESKK